MPPTTFPVGFTKNKSVILGGQEYWNLKYLSKSLNFDFAIKTPKSKRVCFTDTDDLVGYCKMLDKKEVQLAGFPESIGEWSYHYFAPTAVYYIVTNVLISAKPVIEDSVTLTFDSAMLSAVLVLFFIVVFTLYIIERFSSNQNRRPFVSLLFDAFGIMFFESVPVRHLNLACKIVTGIWMIGCFFIISAAFGEITSAATVKKPLTNYINTVEDMKERNISWIIPPTWRLDAFLAEQLPEQAKYKKVMDVTEGLKYVRENPSKYVYIYPEVAAVPFIRLYLWNGKGTNPYHFSQPLVGDVPWMLTIFQRKDSPYKESLTMEMLRSEAAGLLRGKYMPDTLNIIASTSKLDKRYQEKVQTSGISVIHTMGYFLGAGLFFLILSLFSFICEKLKLLVFLRYVIRKVRLCFQQMNE